MPPPTTSSIIQRIAPARNAASTTGHWKRNWRSVAQRSVIQCHAVCATSADRMIVPMALGDDVAEQQAERRDQQHEHEQLPQLDADVERQQRGQQMRAGELQRLAQREREPEAVHEAEGERHEPAAFQRQARRVRRTRDERSGSGVTGVPLVANTMFSSAM